MGTLLVADGTTVGPPPGSHNRDLDLDRAGAWA